MGREGYPSATDLDVVINVITTGAGPVASGVAPAAARDAYLKLKDMLTSHLAGNDAALAQSTPDWRLRRQAISRGGDAVHGNYQVFLGLDVGKDGHHAVALDRDGKRLHDAALVNTETKLRQVFDKLAQHGPVLGVVDQPTSIGALPVAVVLACGRQIAYLPGLAMRRIADLHPRQREDRRPRRLRDRRRGPDHS